MFTIMNKWCQKGFFFKIKLLTLTGTEMWQDWAHLHYHSWSDSTHFVRGRKCHTAHKNIQYWDSKLHTDFVPKLIHMQLVPRKGKKKGWERCLKTGYKDSMLCILWNTKFLLLRLIVLFRANCLKNLQVHYRSTYNNASEKCQTWRAPSHS